MFKSKNKATNNPGKIAKKISDRAIDLQGSTTKHVTKYLGKRTGKIGGVKRFMAGWLVVALGLCVASAVSAWGLHGKSGILAMRCI